MCTPVSVAWGFCATRSTTTRRYDFLLIIAYDFFFLLHLLPCVKLMVDKYNVHTWVFVKSSIDWLPLTFPQQPPWGERKVEFVKRWPLAVAMKEWIYMSGLSAMTKNVSLVERLLLMKVWLYYKSDWRIPGPTSVIPIDCYGATVL